MTRALLTVAAVVTGLTLPATAHAKAAPAPAKALIADVGRAGDGLRLLGRRSSPLSRIERLRVLELRLTTHDGLQVSVVGYGQTVVLSVSNGLRSRNPAGPRRSSSTIYLTHGKVTPDRIEAEFGALGRIAMNFRPKGRYIRATRRAGCTRASRKVVAELGLFSGSFRFRGEHDYASIRAHRARGATATLHSLAECDRGIEPLRPRALLPEQAPSPLSLAAALVSSHEDGSREVPVDPSRRPRPTTLAATSVAPIARTIFGVRMGEEGAPFFIALEQSVEGRLGIVRLASARGHRRGFDFDDALSAATVTPPAPFRGRAVFEHGAGNARSWSGSLAVSFLGAPRVALVGDSFWPRLNRGW